FPPVYRALVEAGTRSGRLAAVLEGLADSARKLREVRHMVLTALVYPVAVVLLSFGLFALAVAEILPRFELIYEGHSPPILAGLASLESKIGRFGVVVPVAIVLVVAVWWYRSSRALVLQRNAGRSGLLSSLPGVRSLLATAQAATLAELLALLLEHEVPLDEAVNLAAGTLNDPRTTTAARSTAIAIRQGGVPAADVAGPNGFTPLLRWMISQGQNERALMPLMRQTARNYRRRTERQADWLRIYLPMLLTVGIGGTATLAYCLTLFIPYADMLKSLAEVR
ncbi:MAG TPA: type II secretion system F family protein, partial [Pirellulales bacterium]|nr:type II secretion system F family protein [Pirellulales bacterium]